MPYPNHFPLLYKYSFYTIFIGSLLFVHTSGDAQSKIQGLVTDSQNAGIANANVLLLRSRDSLLTKGMVTSKSGAFAFENIAKGKYLITATFTGHDQVYSSPVEVMDKQGVINVGTLHLKAASLLLKDVTVTVKKPLFEQKVDRMVVNVANSITSAGSTALEVLERSPGIVVDRQNSVLSMNGKDGVVVMINGKINRMPISAVVQMLAAMTADNIEKIELITTPPANYDAEGNAGYINIVLKENTQYGTNGSYSLSGGYNKRETSEASINFNHRKGKVNLYGDYSISRLHSKQIFTFYHKVLYEGNVNETTSDALRDYVRLFNNGRLGLDYQVAKKTVIGALFSSYDNRFSLNSHNPGTVHSNQILDTIFKLNNKEVNDWFNYSANVNVQHNFSESEKLTFNLDYIHYKDNNPISYENQYYNGNNAFLYDQQLTSAKKTPINIWVAAVDYAKKLSKKVDMEAGVKSTLSKFNNDVEIDRLSGTAWVKDGSLSAIYDLKEKVYAAYTSFNISVDEKTSVKAGLRYEHTTSNLNSETQKNIVDRRYGNFFPSLFFSRTINDNNAFNLSYSRRITRPTFNDMAPFVIFMDPYTFFSGNPALQPSITDVGSVSYTYKKKMLSLSYSYDANPITNFAPKIDPATNIATLAAENQKNQQTFSANLSIPVELNKWWNMQFNASGNFQQLNGYYKGDNIELKKDNLSLNTTQSFKLPKQYSIELNGFYQTGALFGIYKVNSFGALNIGVQKKLKNEKSNFRFNANNVLNSLVFKPTIDLPDQNLVVKGVLHFQYPSFSVTFTHNFGNQKLKGTRQRSSSAEDEKARVQQN